jgi:hypothetical protein
VVLLVRNSKKQKNVNWLLENGGVCTVYVKSPEQANQLLAVLKKLGNPLGLPFAKTAAIKIRRIGRDYAVPLPIAWGGMSSGQLERLVDLIRSDVPASEITIEMLGD